MLKRLYISNYALIDELTIDFEGGLTIITGETGAGKSIIMGALALILGERADSHSVRDKGCKVVVEATFDLQGFDVEDFFEVNDIERFDHECIVRREISATGRSRAFVNDTPVTLGLLKDFASSLIDIHSQHSNALLMKPAFQLQVLDSIAADGELLARYKTEYAALHNLQQELKEMHEHYAHNKAEEDYIRFQLNQLSDLNLHEGEDAELEALQNKLANVAESKDALWNVENELDGEETSVIDNLRGMAQRLEATEKNLPEIAGLAERMRSAAIELKDIAETVSQTNNNLEDDPQQLEQVNERLDAIYSLERKHNVDTSDALLELQHNYEKQISEIDNSDETIRQAERQVKSQLAVVGKVAQELTEVRKEAAGKFTAQLQSSAKGLGMKHIKFDVKFNSVEFSPAGADAVDYMVAFNKNQALMPVKDTASGGEISRLMLCIKAIIAHSMNLPTIIFDEVDTGVSGDVANRIGGMMRDISRRIQVISITHLPQVAAHAREHLLVFKTDLAQATVTQVKRLNADEHVLEIARMLSGKNVDQAAIGNAKSLIQSCQSEA